MAYVRKSKDAKELSELLSKASKSRKTFAGGRKKTGDKPCKPVKIRGASYDRLAEIAHENGMSLAEAFDLVLHRHDAVLEIMK